MDYKKTHIGNLIKTFVKENNINGAELARKIGKTRQNIYDLYKRDDLEVKLFLAISDALNHNFFADIYSEEKNKISVDIFLDALKKLVLKEFSDNYRRQK